MERTLSAPIGWVFPDLGRRVVPEGGRVELTTSVEKRAEYDTAMADLASAGVSLVRTEEQWLLTVDGSTTPYPTDGTGVPEAIRTLLVGVRGGAALRVARRVTRERAVRLVLDADRARLGQIADVHETVATGGAAAAVTERRLLEVSGWSGPFGAAAVKALRKAGATRAGDTQPEAADDVPRTTGDVVRAEIAGQRAALLAGDLALRAGDPAVHRTRIAIRRIRSVLRVVPVTDPQATAALDAELRWYAGVLGQVRDLEVLRAHLRATAAEVREQPGVAAAMVIVEAALDAEHAAAQTTLTRTLTSRRYLALLRTLREWADAPPFTAAADAPVKRIVRYLDKAERRLELRRREALGAADQDEQLHKARKAAKRVRYVAALAPDARAVAKRAKAVQQRLGDHQDAVVAAAFVARVGATATGPAAFGCGVLYGRELRHARHST